MRYLIPIIVLALVGCAADQTSAPPQTAAAPGTAVLCDGTVFDLTRTLTDAELQAFAGTWKGSIVGEAGRYKGCIGEGYMREHVLTESSLRVELDGTGHSCGGGNFEDDFVLPFASRLKGDGFYRRRADGKQQALFIDAAGQLRSVSDTSRSRTCWSHTYQRVE